jgi:hypothetical protein
MYVDDEQLDSRVSTQHRAPRSYTPQCHFHRDRSNQSKAQSHNPTRKTRGRIKECTAKE